VVFCSAVVACGGSDSNIPEGGANDSTAPDDSSAMDSGTDGMMMMGSCDAGLTSCNGQCIDTSSDPKNCGGCGVVCNTVCTKGICQLIGGGCDGGIGSVADNACITLDAMNVYWASGLANGSIWKLPLGGGCPGLVVSGQALPHGVASDGVNLFFGNQGANPGSGSIQRVPIGGGQTTAIATNQSSPLDVVVDGTNVYWTNSGDGSVWKSDKTTPNPIKLAGPNGQGHATHLRLDATYVYFTDRTGGTVNRVPIATGATNALANMGASNANYLALDTKNAYFGANPNNMAAIYSIGLGAMNGTGMAVGPTQARVAGVETDGTNIWFAVGSNTMQYMANTGEIHRMTVTGQNDKILANMQNGPNCISVDSTSVYWINSGGGMISKTGK
jgi:hypothetical protein